MAIKTINGILKEDSIKSVEEFNSQIKNACDNAELADVNNDYVGLVFNLKDKRIDFIPSSSVGETFGVSDTTIVDSSSNNSNASEDEYVRLTAMTTTVGGALPGTTFEGTVSDALDKILYPFVKPTFSSFLLSNQITSLEVGQPLTGGERTFIWATNMSDNVKSNSIKILSGGVIVSEGLNNDGTETINIGGDIVKTTNTTHYFNIYGTDIQNNEFSRIYAVYWKWKIYYGSSPLETISSNDISGFNGLLYTSKNYTYPTPANNYKWICYPVSFGMATKFEDTSTGFGVAMETPQTITLTNEFGITTDYLCYRTTNSMVSSVSIKVS